MSWLRTDSAFWRRALQAGVKYGPDLWVRYSPRLFGAAFGAALSNPRNNVRRNLRRALGERPAAVELRDTMAVFMNFASAMAEGMLLGSGRGYVATNRPVGSWHFQSSVARQKGVIVATAATAGWDVAGAFLREDQGADVWVVMEREQNEAARALHDRHRMATGVKLVHVGDDPLASLPLLRHLRGGGIVAVKFDRPSPTMRSREASFFDTSMRVPEGVLSLAALSGAPILPVFTRRLGFLEYSVINKEPFTLPRRPSETERDHAAQRLADELAAFVRQHPTQWFPFFV